MVQRYTKYTLIRRYYEAFGEQAPELLIKGARLNSYSKKNKM